MNVGTYFSVKDFLNYYIAGLVWCANITLLLLPQGKIELENSLTELSNFSNAANLVLASVLILLIPYLIGFVLTPLSDKIGEQIRRRKPDPVKWVVEDPVKFPAGLKAGEITLIEKYIRKYFHDTDAAPDTWFFQIRALVARDNSGASLLANRALDLTNFSESLVLPLPLLLLIIGVRLMIVGVYLWGLVSLLLAIGVYILLSKRYIDLRSFWVKHIYRAFIAICIHPEISNEYKKETPSE
jgi:hypothetical protein